MIFCGLYQPASNESYDRNVKSNNTRPGTINLYALKAYNIKFKPKE
jgi:hypothetical protein